MITEPNPELFMLVRAGRIHRMNTASGRCWPVAQSLADARRLCEWFNAPKFRAVPVGAFEYHMGQPETLEGHLQMAIDEGCRFVLCVDGWDSTGSPIWNGIPLLGGDTN